MVTTEENTDGCKEMPVEDDDEDIPPNREMEMGDALQLQGKTVNEVDGEDGGENKDAEINKDGENGGENGRVSEDDQLNRLLHECDPSHIPGILFYIGVSSQSM